MPELDNLSFARYNYLTNFEVCHGCDEKTGDPE